MLFAQLRFRTPMDGRGSTQQRVCDFVKKQLKPMLLFYHTFFRKGKQKKQKKTRVNMAGMRYSASSVFMVFMLYCLAVASGNS